MKNLRNLAPMYASPSGLWSAALVLSLLGCAGETFPPIDFPSALPQVETPTGLLVLKRSRSVEVERGPLKVVWVETVSGIVTDGALATKRYGTLRFSEGRHGQVRSIDARIAEPNASDSTQARVFEASRNGIALGALSTGARLDWRVVFESDDVEAFPPISGAGAEPALEAILSVEVGSGIEAQIRIGEGPKTLARATDVLEQRFESVAPGPNGRFGPHPQRTSPWALVVVQSAGGEDLASSWAQVARRADLRAKASAPGASSSFAEGDARRRLTTVRRQLRPFAEEELFHRANRPFGALKAGASAFEAASVLRWVSVDATETTRLALVATDGGAMVFEDLPGLYGFETAVAGFEVGGTWRFGVPSCANCELGRVPVAMAGARAWIVDPDAPRFVSVAATDVDVALSRSQVTWEFDRDGGLRGEALIEFGGALAREVERTIAAAPEAIGRALSKHVLEGLIQGSKAERRGELRPGETLPFAVGVTSQATRESATLGQLAGPALSWFPR
ncbi:MAG: hypothetical protein AAFQ82_06990, partial [Myxococcota bacterium]